MHSAQSRWLWVQDNEDVGKLCLEDGLAVVTRVLTPHHMHLIVAKMTDLGGGGGGMGEGSYSGCPESGTMTSVVVQFTPLVAGSVPASCRLRASCTGMAPEAEVRALPPHTDQQLQSVLTHSHLESRINLTSYKQVVHQPPLHNPTSPHSHFSPLPTHHTFCSTGTCMRVLT